MVRELTTRCAALFECATRANVNVYTVDVCGLRVAAGRRHRLPTCMPGLEVDYLQTLAENTGAPRRHQHERVRSRA